MLRGNGDAVGDGFYEDFTVNVGKREIKGKVGEKSRSIVIRKLNFAKEDFM